MNPYGAGFPSMGGGYPQPPQPGFPPQQGFTPQTGYPPQQGYPLQPGYPPQQGYPQQPSGYPAQQGFPLQQAPNLNPAQPVTYPQPNAYGGLQNSVPYYPSVGPQTSAFPNGPTGIPAQQQLNYMNPNCVPPAVLQAQHYGGMTSGAHAAAKQGTPTVVAIQSEPLTDAATLRKAMKGFGTDEDAIINVLCRRTNAQRQAIARCFKTSYGKDLINDIKSETSGNFEKLLVALLTPTDVFYAKELYDAIAGLGTDEEVLIETLCTMSNKEITDLKNAFTKTYGKKLEDFLIDDTSGHFKRLMVSLCSAGRDESIRVDPNQAREDANALLKAGKLRVGTDESTFNMILCQRSPAHLKLVFEQYQQLSGCSLEKSIKSEFSGDIETGLLAIVRSIRDQHEYFASCLHKSMAGLGTNDRQLIRLVVTRCEKDMEDIKVAFQRKYSKTLKSFIKGDTSGHYKHALYALIGENRD